ncbi:PPPDE domain-containing protein [Heracleum sosnowskyi]|uniref:PPPDE domain-containing protein n=1 Tax=Heracleum sosnowskyi TaxID=360622 RepID=A0AAD8MUP4_9APIA|nr:PPPDE domain-containing protein [Heracleum sosnowskyi]
MEYGFGAHDLSMSGVFEAEPKSCPGFIYRCSIPLGRIDMPFSKYCHFLETVASEYHGDTYHLITKNCNHFTDDISSRLTGNRIPGWVNRLAKLGGAFKFDDLFEEKLGVSIDKEDEMDCLMAGANFLLKV